MELGVWEPVLQVSIVWTCEISDAFQAQEWEGQGSGRIYNSRTQRDDESRNVIWEVISIQMAPKPLHLMRSRESTYKRNGLSVLYYVYALFILFVIPASATQFFIS